EDGMLLASIQHKGSGARWRRSTPVSLHVPGAGEHIMSVIRRIPFVLILSLLVSTSLFGLAASAPAVRSSSAPVESLRDPSAPHGGRDQPGSIVVLLRVRALVPEKVTLSDPAQGTVHATVVAIDEEPNQIKVQTEAGQRLMLFLPPESLAHLHVGAPCLLQVVNGPTREASRPPEHEEAFW